MQKIDHFLHRHPLTLTKRKEVDDKIVCTGCGDSLSDSVYGCSDCEFYLHKSCSELPREIQSFFHPCHLLLQILSYTCNACFKHGSGFSYRCKQCDFDMHVECAQQPIIKSQGVEELIHHFTHWHPLTLADQIKHLEVRCGICEKLCFGSDSSAYCCEECNFFVHNSCMINIPRQINHFFHPSCPLILLTDVPYQCKGCGEAGSGLAFRCGKCRFQLDVKCALLPTVESKDANKIQHCAHNHPLAVRESKEFGREVRCRACGETCLLDPSFGCSKRSCDFFLHRKCAVELRLEIHHLFHPLHPLILLTDMPNRYQCNGCEEVGSGLAYCCTTCNFLLDAKCALLPTAKSKDADKIQHSAHKHPLALRESKEFGSEVRCRACGENCLLDPCFGCVKRSCDFFLHRTCAVELLQEIRHIFHPLHPLIALSSFPYRCKACDEDGSVLAYCCVNCKFQLHVKCALLPTIESKDADKIQHGAHKHPLAIRESKEFGSEARCRACAGSCLVPCFGCKECNFFLHRTCAVELRQKEIYHPFHPLHPLTLLSPPPAPGHDTLRCSACLGSINCFLLRYHCAKCDFDLHIDCAKPKLTPVIKYEGHTHHLTFFDKTQAPLRCNICNEDVQSGFCRCVACSFSIHLYCIPSAPKTIKHKCHLHPLTVTKSPFEFESASFEYEGGSDDEFYCDVCEEKRCKNEWVYYCAECKFIAEVRCILSELLPFLIVSKDQSITMKGTVISRDERNSAVEATIAKQNNEIAKLKQTKKALKVKVEEHRAKLKTFEKKLEETNRRLVELKTDRFLYKYQLSQREEK